MSVYQQHKPGGGDELYLKLKDGDKVKMRIASEPVISVFKRGDRPRYSWVVLNRDKDKAQVYTSGVSVYRQIADLSEEWGDPKTFDITVKRAGSGQFDTEYSVTPVKTSQELTKDELKAIGAVDLVAVTKGKWLKEYVEDRLLPDPVDDSPRDEGSGYDRAKATARKIDGKNVIEGAEPVNLDDIPF